MRLSNTWTTLDDVIALWRSMNVEEQNRADSLIPIVEANLRQEAYNVGRDLDRMINDGKVSVEVVKSVVVDVVARTLMTSTKQEPMTQYSEAVGGYSVSGTFLNAGGGLFIKRSELARLGIRRQKVGVIDLC